MELSVTQAFTAVAETVPARECIVFRDRRLSYADVLARSRGFARFLLDAGISVRAERDSLQNWESGQDHVAIYLQNCSEYLEVMLGSFAARAVPINVNYRYIADEVQYVLRDAGARVLVYHIRYAPLINAIRPHLESVKLLVHIDDGSGEAPCGESVAYEDTLRSAPAFELITSPNDLYAVYTGGTTGLPKGTLWRQSDAVIACFGIRERSKNSDRDSHPTLTAAVERESRFMTVPPFMHGAAQWTAFNTLLSSGTVIISDGVEHLNPSHVWAQVAREQATGMLIVGEAFGRPLAEGLPTDCSELSSLERIMTGGAALTAGTRERLRRALPSTTIVDMMGSSESGGVMRSVIRPGSVSGEVGIFTPSPGTSILDESKTKCLTADDTSVGWLARSGHIPLGYLGDQEKTDRTFVEAESIRWTVLGDRARYVVGGAIQLLGRDSVTINTGGEKVFAEEVERALLAQDGVIDVVVVGRPSERWGQEIVAVAQLQPGTQDEAILQGVRTLIASYKVPKDIISVPLVRRSPAGKADYSWARACATQEGSIS